MLSTPIVYEGKPLLNCFNVLTVHRVSIAGYVSHGCRSVELHSIRWLNCNR